MDYQWNFSAFEVKNNHNNLNEVVVSIYYELNAIESSYRSSISGKANLLEPDAQNFIAFQDLTQKQVQEWVENAIGQNELQTIKNNLEAKIQELKNPLVKTLPAPWLQVPETFEE